MTLMWDSMKRFVLVALLAWCLLIAVKSCGDDGVDDYLRGGPPHVGMVR